MTSDKIYDLCVIGSGPAGIITILEYNKINPQNSILLIEYGFAGQPEKNNLDESIDLKNPENHHNPYHCTNKGLGGTSKTWGGRCVMFDEIDFMKRPSVDGNCTWDLNFFDEVKPYTPKAAEYFECGEPKFNLNQIPEFKNTRIAENFKDGIVTDQNLERWSMPTRFGSRYRKDLEKVANIKILEGYEAKEFGELDDNAKAESLTIRDVRSDRFCDVRAKNFVIAAGTQESTRLLLKNKHLFRELDKVPTSLGRYYQCHLLGKIASIIFDGDPKKTDFGFLRNQDGTYMRRRLQFTTKYLKENDLLNTVFWLDNPLYYDPKHKNGAMSFMYLVMLIPFLGKKLAPPAIAHSITKGKRIGVRKHLWNLAKDLPGSLTAPAKIFYKRYLIKRKLPGIFLYSPMNKYALYFHSEQIPLFENRMELSPDGEKLNIHYEFADKDIDSIIETHKALDTYLREINCGRLEYWYKEKDLDEVIREISIDGVHQIGTTRIADSPEDGVVDRNLKVHGTDNVYVCSSSVFPTSGHANPTFFLGACAVRLANYLK